MRLIHIARSRATGERKASRTDNARAKSLQMLRELFVLCGSGKCKSLKHVKASGGSEASAGQGQGCFDQPRRGENTRRGVSKVWPASFPSGEGSDLAGIVTQVGIGVEGITVGDEVIGFTDRRASHAEYVVVDAQNLTRKPANALCRYRRDFRMPVRYRVGSTSRTTDLPSSWVRLILRST